MSEQHDTGNDEVLREIAGLKAYVDTRFVTTEYLDNRMTRLGLDVMATLSSQLQAMMRDAMSSAIKEEMNDVQTQFRQMQGDYRALTTNTLTEEKVIDVITQTMKAEQDRARQERREDFQRLFNYVKVGVPTLVGLLTMVNLLGGWFGWWG